MSNFAKTADEALAPIESCLSNQHGVSATPNNEIACTCRFPLPIPLVKLLANPLSQQAGKWLVIPEGEGDYESLREFHSKQSLAGRIDAILPQTQCEKCGYPGCRPYAEAIATGQADINLCPPGGEDGIHKLAALLGREFKPFAAGTVLKPKSVAWIDETLCIGCTLCLQACPVDAIAGAAKQMHTIIASECTGCELCVAPCPVDCISMLPLPQNTRKTPDSVSPTEYFSGSEIPAGTQERQAANLARERHEFRKFRMERDKQEKAERLAAKEQAAREQSSRPVQPTALSPADVARQKIQAAIELARQQAAASKPKNTDNLTAQQLAKIAEIEARRAHLRELANKQHVPHETDTAD